MTHLDASNTSLSNDEMIVAKALVNAAKRLTISNVELSDIIGVSEPQLSRISKLMRPLAKNSKAFELALLFIRLFRSLDTIVGGDEKSANSWLRAYNFTLFEKPIERIKSIEGLIDVIAYLDSQRAVI